MVKNYLLSALRSLLQRKSLLALNIFGFSLGLSSALLMFAFCWDEIGYDTYHPDHDRLYRVALTRYFPDRQNSYATSPPPLGPTMYHEFPEVIDFCRVFDSGNETRIRLDDRVFYEERLFAADSSFFTLFGVRLLAGNPREALSTPNAVVITEEISKKYFGNSQALNQTLEIGDTTKFVVKGIAENVPKRSHFKFDLLISLRSLPIADNNFWGSYSIHNYVKLDEQDNVASVTDKIPALLEARMGPQVENILGKTYKEYVEAGNIHDFFLQPIKDIHLKSQFTNELDVNGDWKYVLLFFTIGLLVLIIAGFNFTNLTTANSVNRSKEIGVRKVMGSTRKQLVIQFLTEANIVSLLAVIIAVLIALLLLPSFNLLAGKEIALQDFDASGLVIFLLVLSLLVGTSSGLYPAFFMARTGIVKIFKGGIKLSNSKFGLRNMLVTFQFVASIFMILATVSIVAQVRYMMERNLGFAKDQILLLEVANNLGDQYESFLNEVENQPFVEKAASAFHVPGRQSGGGTFQAIGVAATERFLFSLFITDYQYVQTFDMKMIAGRNFDENLASDTAAVLINKACARMVGWEPETALGKEILITAQPNPVKIVGVLEDFHHTSLHEPITPMVFAGLPRDNLNVVQPPIISIKLVSNVDFQSTLQDLEQLWRRYAPEEVFRYNFLDSEFDQLYQNDQNFAAIFKRFAMLAIVISLIGVVGLSLFIASERVKEIGIRKVLGASVQQIMVLLSKDFMVLVGVANLIAWPTTYYLVNSWMKGYAFSAAIDLTSFALITVIFAAFVLIVISVVTFRAANENPVKTIGSE